MRSKKMMNALEAMPCDAPIVRDLLRMWDRAYCEAVRLQREAREAKTGRERRENLSAACKQMQMALNCLREASEQSHRAARTPARVGHAVPSWLAKREDRVDLGFAEPSRDISVDGRKEH